MKKELLNLTHELRCDINYCKVEGENNIEIKNAEETLSKLEKQINSDFNITWEELSMIIDNISWNVFKESTGDRDTVVGFRELIPVIENKEMLLKLIEKYKK